MKIAIYPGTFDPITYGHIDVLERAIELFDKVVVTIARNSAKSPLFSDEERLDMIRTVTKKYPTVEVDSFDGLMLDYAKKKKATAVVRGLRAISDFEYEFQMALMNRKIARKYKFTTVFLMPHESHTYLNSSIVKDLARLGGEVKDFVPPYVKKCLLRKFEESKRKFAL
jgi:pantetheine-phosphate adenylyltransferase